MSGTMRVNQRYTFDFERNFDYKSEAKWFREHYNFPISAIAVYLIAIFTIQSYMKTRKAFDLKIPLAIWNSLLAIFSVIGSLRFTPDFIFDVRVFGLHTCICDNTHYQTVGVYWGWLFALSKVVELGDTLFIVLRKKKLMFLHWYHHTTILFASWISYGDLSSTGEWFIVLNYAVHSIMYTYYALRAMNIKVPRRLPMFITTIQILQMVVGVFVCCYAFVARELGSPCAVSDNLLKFSLFVGVTYLYLFLKYFYDNYVRNDLKEKKKST